MSSLSTRMPVAVGVVGVGHLGSHHARIFHESSDWNLTAIFDSDPEKNRDAATRFNVAICRDAGELLTRVDAVSICTPTESHFDIARRAMECGRHVFVEKPVCSSMTEAGALTVMAQKAGVVGAVGQIERFNPAINAALTHIGTPRFIEAHRLNQFSLRGLTTDVVLELMIHDIDLVRWLVGAEPIEIRAAGVPVLSRTDDIANCRLAFANGCVANLTASRISANPMRKIRVFSQDHYTSIDLAAKSADSYQMFDEGAEPQAEGYMTLAAAPGRRIARWSSPVAIYDALEAELADFHAAIRERRSPRVDLAEGARSLRVALDVVRACQDHAKDPMAVHGGMATPAPV